MCLLSNACENVNARVGSYSTSKERVKVLLLNQMCGRGEAKESEKEKEREGRKRGEAWRFSEVKWGRQLYPGVVVVGRGSQIRDAFFMLFLSLGNPSPVLSTFLQNSFFLLSSLFMPPLHEFSTFIFFIPGCPAHSLLCMFFLPYIILESKTGIVGKLLEQR